MFACYSVSQLLFISNAWKPQYFCFVMLQLLQYLVNILSSLRWMVLQYITKYDRDRQRETPEYNYNLNLVIE